VRYVYLLQSIPSPDQRYVGITSDFRERLKQHNTGQSSHTSKFRQWKPVVVIRFEDNARGAQFEQYLKSGSGRAFANKHFWQTGATTRAVRRERRTAFSLSGLDLRRRMRGSNYRVRRRSRTTPPTRRSPNVAGSGVG